MSARSRSLAPDLEPVFVAFAATSALGIPVAHLLSALLGAAGRPALGVTLAIVAVALLCAIIDGLARSDRLVLWARAILPLAAAGGLLLARGAAVPQAVAVASAGLAQTFTAGWLAARLAPALSGSRRRHRLAAAVLTVVGLALVIQSGRLGTYMADPSSPWWLTTRDPNWAQHACLPAYIEAADLHRQDEANVYDAKHYLVLNRDAQPHLTVSHMEAFAGDPFQYPPPFLVVPAAAVALWGDYLPIRTIWYGLSLLLFVGVAVALARWVAAESGALPLWLVPVVCLSAPAVQSLQFGNVHITAVALAVAAMLAIERRRDALGGALLAGAALAKIFPGVLVLVLLVRRRWKALGYTAGFAALFTAAALAVLGTAPFRAFVEYQLPRLANGQAFDFLKAWPEWRSWLIPDDLSPQGVVEKLGILGVPGMGAGATFAVKALFALLLVAVVVIAGRRSGEGRRGGEGQPGEPRWVEAATWLAVLNLAAMQSQRVWADYVPVGTVWLLSLVPAEFYRRPLSAVLLCFGWLFAGLLSPGVFAIPGVLPSALAISLSAAGTLLIIAVNAWAAVRAKAGVPA